MNRHPIMMRFCWTKSDIDPRFDLGCSALTGGNIGTPAEIIEMVQDAEKEFKVQRPTDLRFRFMNPPNKGNNKWQ